VFLHRLRSAVAPAIRQLQAAGGIGWFGFLVHDYHSGVPTDPTDRDAYVHIRVTLSPDASLDDRLVELRMSNGEPGGNGYVMAEPGSRQGDSIVAIHSRAPSLARTKGLAAGGGWRWPH
jgi:hypothetical protein